MATGALSSDHVNYLIWRYLQESGYGQAAVKLQQYWLREQDPQALPFAPDINRRALLSLIHKGLKYNQVEQLHSKATSGEGGSSAAALYFGTAATGRHSAAADQSIYQQQQHQQLLESRINAASASINLSNTSLAPQTSSYSPSTAIKRPPDTAEDGPPLDTPEAKRSRHAGLSSGADLMQVDQNGVHSTPTTTDTGDAAAAATTHDDEAGHHQQGANGMDVDDDDTATTAATNEETAAAAAPPIPTLVDGHSIGIQSEKVRDLASASITLTVPERDQIMHTTWNPLYSSLLATGGDGLCRLWHVPEEAALPDQLDIKTPSRDISLPSDTTLITSVAWSPDGQMLALATQGNSAESVGTVSTWTESGMAVDELTAGQELVIKLCWNTDGSRLLGVASSGDGTSSLIVWNMETESQPMPPVACAKVITDAAWTGPRTITVCGHGAIGRWDLDSPQGLMWAMKTNTVITDGRWTSLCYNPANSSMAVFEEERASLVVIDASGNLVGVKQAHKSALTATTTAPSTSSATPPLVATAAADGSVINWDMNSITPRSTFLFSHDGDTPALALSFSPDRTLLAAVSTSKLLIWDIESPSSTPIAVYRGSSSTPSIFSHASSQRGGVPSKRLLNGHGSAGMSGTGLGRKERDRERDKDSGIGDDDGDGEGDGESTATSSLDDEVGVSVGWNAGGDKLAVGMGSYVAVVRVRS